MVAVITKLNDAVSREMTGNIGRPIDQRHERTHTGQPHVHRTKGTRRHFIASVCRTLRGISHFAHRDPRDEPFPGKTPSTRVDELTVAPDHLGLRPVGRVLNSSQLARPDVTLRQRCTPTGAILRTGPLAFDVRSSDSHFHAARCNV